MKKFFIFFIVSFFVILMAIECMQAEASGIGVSPGKLDLGYISPDTDYKKEIIIVNPNDFDIEFFINSPKNIKISPDKEYITRGQTKRINLNIRFREINNEKEILVINIINKNAPDHALAMLPGVALSLEYDYDEYGSDMVRKSVEDKLVDDDSAQVNDKQKDRVESFAKKENTQKYEIMQFEKKTNQQKQGVSNKPKYDDDSYKVDKIDKMLIFKIESFLLVALILMIIYTYNVCNKSDLTERKHI